MIIGADEAQMMQDEKLFQAEGDLIRNLFGNDVIVAGVLPKTNTPAGHDALCARGYPTQVLSR